METQQLPQLTCKTHRLPGVPSECLVLGPVSCDGQRKERCWAGPQDGATEACLVAWLPSAAPRGNPARLAWGSHVA